MALLCDNCYCDVDEIFEVEEIDAWLCDECVEIFNGERR